MWQFMHGTLQAFSEPKWKLEIIVQYFSKYCHRVCFLKILIISCNYIFLQDFIDLKSVLISYGNIEEVVSVSTMVFGKLVSRSWSMMSFDTLESTRVFCWWFQKNFKLHMSSYESVISLAHKLRWWWILVCRNRKETKKMTQGTSYII